jgi:hypothetical protein
LALRAEIDRRELHTARARLVRNVRTTMGVPFALSGCFFAGIALGRAVAPLGGATLHQGRRLGSWYVFAARALQIVALSRATAR